MYEVHILRVAGPGGGPSQALVVSTAVFERHKAATLRVLAAADARDEALGALLALVSAPPPAPAQQQVAMALVRVQEMTLETVLAVAAWRRTTTLPFPFFWRGTPLVRRVSADARLLAASALPQIIPVAAPPPGREAEEIDVLLPRAAADLALRRVAAAGPPPRPASDVAKARAIVADEADVQARVAAALRSAASAALLLPLVASPLLPGGRFGGVPIADAEWQRRWRREAAAAAAAAEAPLEVADVVRVQQVGAAGAD